MSSPRKRVKTIHDIRRAWTLVRPHERRRLQLVALYGVLIAGLDTLALLLVYALISLLNHQPVTWIAATLTDALHLSGSDRYRAALILLLITAALFVARSLLSILGLWLTIGAGNAAQADLISRLLVGHARAPLLLRLEQNSSETLRTVLSSVSQVTLGVVSGSVSLLANGAVALAVAVGLLLASPSVAVAVMVYFALIAVVWARVIRGTLVRRGRSVQELQEEQYRLVLQGISAAKELQLRGRALFYAEGAVARTRRINAAMRGAGVVNGGLRYVLETSLVIGAVLVVAVAGLTSGRASALPAVGLVLAGAFRLLPALNQVLFLNNQVQFNSSAIDFVERDLRTFGVFGEDSARLHGPVAAPLRLEHELCLNSVTFRYPTRTEPALRGISVSVRPGESIGVVGPTGSGKSTLLDVILGMLDPDAGSVAVDGAPLPECREAWQRSIGYVPQDVYLVDDTLSANVALGWYGDDIDKARVLESVRLAGLEELVAALANGLETVVGERGVRLSGGQRQRVGLARALYTSPSVLVLDEATSNLDQATEHRIVETLAALQGGVTMIVVTHRTASVRHCDRLIYLEDGAVRASGTFDQISALVPQFDEPAPPRLVAQVR
jgi:ABC-type multidrug transport system fused ATPase/permease subunit